MHEDKAIQCLNATEFTQCFISNPNATAFELCCDIMSNVTDFTKSFILDRPNIRLGLMTTISLIYYHSNHSDQNKQVHQFTIQLLLYS